MNNEQIDMFAKHINMFSYFLKTLKVDDQPFLSI